MHIVLIANYLPDRQESMRRFAEMLESGLRGMGHQVDVLRPRVVFGKFGFGPSKKWLAYIDKYLLFPQVLRKKCRAFRSGHATLSATTPIFHICDHSNAVYRPFLNGALQLITCHDLLAIRRARGDFPEYPTARTGRILQDWILSELRQFKHVACVSHTTSRDLSALGPRDDVVLRTIYNGLNFPFRRLDLSSTRDTWQTLGSRLGLSLPDEFLFHIGGTQWYKNRKGLIEIYSRLVSLNPSAPPLLIAGKSSSPGILAAIEGLGLSKKVIHVGSVSNEELNALYSRAKALIFPSLAEGFGWPIIEAQASGCPVITSNRPPMNEIGGEPSLCIDPTSPDDASRQILELMNESSELRESRIAAGLSHAKKFSAADMLRQYIDFYGEVSARASANTSQGI